MAMRPRGGVGVCVAALADGKVNTVGSLGKRIGNWVGPSWGKGLALPVISTLRHVGGSLQGLALFLVYQLADLKPS